MHVDALKPGSRVLLIDDLLATGGTAGAAASLVKKLGAHILEIGFLIELKFLNGSRPAQGRHSQIRSRCVQLLNDLAFSQNCGLRAGAHVRANSVFL